MPACRHGIQLANTLAMLFLLLPSPSLLSYPIHRPSPGFGHFAADVVLLVELVAAITRTLRVSSAPSETVREVMCGQSVVPISSCYVLRMTE